MTLSAHYGVESEKSVGHGFLSLEFFFLLIFVSKIHFIISQTKQSIVNRYFKRKIYQTNLAESNIAITAKCSVLNAFCVF